MVLTSTHSKDSRRPDSGLADETRVLVEAVYRPLSRGVTLSSDCTRITVTT
jgi:hypothetical protein